MVEGNLTIPDRKESYELPSQADLIRQAFAGDDVEAEFEKDKMDVLNEENPEPEKPALVPGWGQWTDIQQKKGLPSWMIKEHEVAKRNREEALKRRKDSKLKHVIISEHVDKKVKLCLIHYIHMVSVVYVSVVYLKCIPLLFIIILEQSYFTEMSL
jgi:U3 small nucleolar RNA-associated protein 14